MVRKLPPLLGCTAERTNALLANLEAYGFSQDEVRAMVRKLPPLLGCTAERTNAGLDAVCETGLDAVFYAKLLMVSPALLRGRSAVCRARGIEVCASILNMTNAQFTTAYGMDRAAVIALDPMREETAPE